MKNSRSLSYLSEYLYGEDNILTAAHHEELRLRTEARVRGAQSALRLQDLAISDASPSLNNAKRIQQELDRQETIARQNQRLLQRLERIHEQVPPQFDISHHSRAVLDAPRATNLHRRRREDERIAAENDALARRLRRAKGSFSPKRFAADAERHQYLSDQISKVQRRDKARQKCRLLASTAAAKVDVMQTQLQQQTLAAKSTNNRFGKDDEREREREYVLVALQPAPMRPSQCDVPAPSTGARKPQQDALPAVASRRKVPEVLAGSPTVSNSSKVISAKELLRIC